MNYIKTTDEHTQTSSSFASHDLLFDLDKLGDHFLIVGDSNRGLLSIYLQPGIAEKEEEQIHNLMRMIRVAFNEFKEEMRQQSHFVDQFACNCDPDELLIRFSSPKYYDAFMQHLADKKLLPQTFIKQLQQMDSEKPQQIQGSSDSSPPYPSSQPMSAEEQRAYTPFPFRTTLVLENEPWTKD